MKSTWVAIFLDILAQDERLEKPSPEQHGVDGRRGRGAWWPALVLTLFVQVCPAPGVASALQTAIRGKVIDQEGNPLAGARCIFTHQAQNVKIPVITGKSGRFIRSGLPSGQYEITCELVRYAHEPVGVQIGGQQERTLEFRMVRTESPNYTVGFQAFSDGRFEEAIAQMEITLIEDPDDVRAEYILGLSLAQTGKHEEALELLKSVANSGNELVANANLSIGETYFLMGNEEVAEEYFQKANDPAVVSSMFAQAGTRAFNGGQMENSLRYFQKALQLNQNNVDALYGLGLCYISANQRDEALEALKRLISTAPDHEKAKLAAGLVEQLEANR